MANKTWSMNDTQKQFIAVLGEYDNGATLLDIKLEKGIEFKTGSINTLVAKGFVEIAGDKEYVVDIVFNGNKVGNQKLTRKVYRLVK